MKYSENVETKYNSILLMFPFPEQLKLDFEI